MKLSSAVTKTLSSSAVALFVAASFVNLPANAQTNDNLNTAPNNNPTAPTTGVDSGAYRQDNDGFDWGWLGLLGLIGLAGLARKPEERVYYRDDVTQARTGTRDY